MRRGTVCASLLVAVALSKLVDSVLTRQLGRYAAHVNRDGS
ncbi:MAG: hypothetical protein CMLOHMNK_01028 [Steroidobacteraceae bacterium]|nr:hypothetical protein [Steroidobacteraceae bacterium]